MEKQKTTNFLHNKRVLVFLLALLGATFSCMLLDKLLQKEERITIRYEYYAIKPDSILTSLYQGDSNVFTFLKNDPVYNFPYPGSTVSWKQSDYFFVITAFYKIALGDSLESWNLTDMRYSLSCDEIEYGFQDGRFNFFKVLPDERGGKKRVTRFIDIDARYNVVVYAEDEYYPKLMNWDIIDLENIKITADSALRIAEMNGGKEKRLAADRPCYVSVSINPASVAFVGWLVSYSYADSSPPFFNIEIDPITGKIHSR